MKQASRTKKILIIASILVLAGLALAAVGFFTGAKLNISMGNYGVTVNGGSGGKTLKTENGLKLDAFSSVEGKIGDSSVRFVPSDHFGMDLAYYEQDSRPKVEVNNGTLQITQLSDERNETWFQINFGAMDDREAGKITVYYPKGTHLNTLNLDDGNGSMDLSGLSAQNTDINCTYGDFTLKDFSSGVCDIHMENGSGSLAAVQTGTLKFTNEYGSSNFDSVEVSGSGETAIDASNGKISMSNCRIPALTLTDSYGSISLASLKTGSLNAKLENGSLSMTDSTIADAHVENSYGAVEAMRLTLSGGDIRSKNGSISLGGLLKGRIALHSDYGSIKVTTSLPQNQYRCDFSTDYGSVSLNGKKYGKSVFMPTNAVNSLDVTAGSGDITADFPSEAAGKTA